MGKLSINTVLVACLLAVGGTAPLVYGAEKTGSNPTNVTIKLDWAWQGPESPFLYGKTKGFFKDEGLHAELRRGKGTTLTVTQVAAGAVQFGWAALGGLIKFDLKHPDQRLTAVYVSEANSPATIVTEKGRGISEPKDLDGKTIDATAGSSARALFKLFANNTGIDASSIKWMTVSGQLREPMMVRGTADALAGFTTSSILSVNKLGVPMNKIVVMQYSKYGVQQYGRALMVRSSFMEKHPKTVAAVVKAVNRSFKAAIADPMASAKTLPSRDPLVVVATECKRLRSGFVDLTLSKKFKTDGLSSVDPDRLHKAVVEVKTAYGMTGKLPNKDVYTDKFLPPQADRIPPSLGTCR